MSENAPPPAFARLRQLIDGFQVSDAIHTAARLNVAPLLEGGPRSAESLAAELTVDAAALYRLLRALASFGVFEEEPGQVFKLNDLGMLLLPDVPQSLRAWSLLTGSPYFREAWAHLDDSVRTGENAFRLVHNGVDVWTWRGERPEESRVFDAAMAGLSGAAAAAVVASFDFSPFRTIADIGGGDGTLLAAILCAAPGARGIVFDQEHVVDRAGAALERAGVAERAELVAGSFFESVPPSLDAYVLKSVLHDWTDEECRRVLAVVRQAMREGSRLVVVEQVVEPIGSGPVAKLSDLNMLVMPGGRERTEVEWRSLLTESGFGNVAFHRTASPSWVIEAQPA